MAVDNEFFERFKKEAELLRKLHTEVGKAIERADKKIERMHQGESQEDIFGTVPPKQ